MIRAGRVTTAMVVTAEVENNAETFPTELLGIEETGSALILTGAGGEPSGLGRFSFRAFEAHVGALATHCINRDATTCLVMTRDPEVERLYVDAIVTTVADYLTSEGIDLRRITHVLPPQISPAFITRLSGALGLPRDVLVDVTCDRRDLFTSSVPFALRSIVEQRSAAPGELGLIISVGSGIQVGCALCHF